MVDMTTFGAITSPEEVAATIADCDAALEKLGGCKATDILTMSACDVVQLYEALQEYAYAFSDLLVLLGIDMTAYQEDAFIMRQLETEEDLEEEAALSQ